MMPNDAMSGSAGLDISRATVTYRSGLTAVHDASFTVPAGTITALVGVNGSGKSTLFKAIMGFLRLAQGSISVLGMPVQTAIRRKLIAYVPQSEELDWNFPILVEDVVMMGRYGHMGFMRRPGAGDRDAVEQALARVGMADFRKRQIGELSGGQRKRVFLARALAQDGRVILLDEPFTGVDVTTEDAIIQLLGGLRDEGRVLLVSTHNLGSVPEFCDRTVLINRTVLAQGLTSEVFTPQNLAKTFGGMLRHFELPPASTHMPRGAVGIITDDERPLVIFRGRSAVRERTGPADKAEHAADWDGAQ